MGSSLPELVGKLGNHAEQGRPEYRLSSLPPAVPMKHQASGVYPFLPHYCGPSPARIHEGLRLFLLRRRQDPRIGDVVARFGIRNTISGLRTTAAISVACAGP